MRIGSLCSGYGGLDLAVEEVFAAETIWHAEVDPHASKVLEARWGVPNLGDLTKVDWSQVTPVDVLTAGWPCQPWSLAGKQKGTEDERAIWPQIARAVRELRPRYVVLENVSAVVVLGELARAAGDLAQAGYDAQWTCLSASEVGAPHKRERFFIVAADTDGAAVGEPTRGASAEEAGTASCDGLGDSGGEQPAGDWRGTPLDLLPTPKAAERGDCRSEHERKDPDLRAITYYTGQWGKYAPAIQRWEQVTRPAPPPTEPNSKGNPRLSARFAEWMMGLPDGWVTDIDLPRSAHLKILGNGVVPAQAAAALRFLLSIEQAA